MHVELIFLLRTGSHKTQNNKVFYEFKIIDLSCMLAHLENANIATVAQSKPYLLQAAAYMRISAEICNNTVVSHGVLPTRTFGEKLDQKRKKLFFGW